jgi:rare lipoprotein A
MVSVAGVATAQSSPPASFTERFFFGPKSERSPAQSTKRRRPAFLRDLGVAPAEAAGPSATPPASASEATSSPTVGQEAAGPPAPSPPAASPTVGQSAAPAEKTADAPRGRPIARGVAAYYEHPGRTASGLKYDPDGFTAAHRSLPFGTRVRVVNLNNKKSVVVKINDRTPPKLKYVIDLSRGSARAIGITKTIGVGNVALFMLD